MLFDIERYWYQQKLKILMPLAWIFKLCIIARKFCYQFGILKVYKFPVPVIVVGNITVGGTGKTPFVIWLVEWLREQGYAPGIILRGIGGSHSRSKPYVVNAEDTAKKVGDEACMLSQATQSPVVICTKRPAAAHALLKHYACDIIISDDGLQHYALARDIEIIMVDGNRRFGNGCLLPAGPLREPPSRLKKANLVVVNNGNDDELAMRLELSSIESLKGKRISLPPQRIHAVAAIGNPNRFFMTLQQAGFTIIPHIFADHYHYKEIDLDFNDDLPIIMTAKDAVKCKEFAKDNWWCANVKAKVNQNIPALLLKALQLKHKV